MQKFGFNALKEALGLDKSSYEIVENSSRFGLMNRFTVLRNFGIRSMNTKNIVFPYWENRARAYEDLAALLLILELLCLVYPVIFAAGKIHWLWKHKTEIRRSCAVDQGACERAADLDEACESTRMSGEKTVTLEKIKEWRYSGQNTALMYL